MTDREPDKLYTETKRKNTNAYKHTLENKEYKFDGTIPSCHCRYYGEVKYDAMSEKRLSDTDSTQSK